MASLHPLECYLLEKYSSVNYFANARDAIIEWIDTHEAAFARFQANVPPRQRAKPLWQQPDVTWGSKVLPNIRPCKDFYSAAYIKRVNENPSAFKAGHVMAYHNRGVCECWDGWMTDLERADIERARRKASKIEGRIGYVTGGSAREGSFTYCGLGSTYALSDVPQRIPRYTLDSSVRLEKSESVKEIGIYLPDIEFAAARLLYPNGLEGGVKALQGIARTKEVSETGQPHHDWVEEGWAETGWTLIRRVENEFIEVPPGGFFPKGHPDELYSWPEREAQYIRRETPHITRMSGELAPHYGLWSLFRLSHPEGHVTVNKGERLPVWEGQAVEWIMVRRLDGASQVDG